MTVPLRNPHGACYLLKEKAFLLSLYQLISLRYSGRLGALTFWQKEVQN